MERISIDEAYMQMAEVWAKRSYATRNQVGALLVKDGQIISDGWNGMPSKLPNDEIEYRDGDGKLHTSPLVIHAEANVFDKLSCNGQNVGAKGATLYITLSPCIPCALRIINNKVARVVFRNTYRDTSGLELLQKRTSIEVVQLAREMPDVVPTSPPSLFNELKYWIEWAKGKWKINA